MSLIKRIAIVAWVCSVAIGTRYVFGPVQSFGEQQYLEYITPYLALSTLVHLGILIVFAREALSWITSRTLAVVFFVGVIAITPSTSPLLSLWWFGVLMTIAWSTAALSTALKNSEYKKTFFVSLIALGSSLSVIAIIQFALQHSLGLSFLGEPEANAQTLGVAKVLLGGEKLLRPFGTFPHANVLGGSLVASFVALLSQKNSLFTRYPLVFQVLLGLHILAAVFSYSRSTWICFLLILTYYAYHYGLKTLLPSISIGIICLTLFSSATLGRFNLQSQSQQVDIRTIGTSQAVDMISENPLGIGLRGFIPELIGLNPELPIYYYQPAHNVVLLIGVELGILGAAATLAIFAWALFSARTREGLVPVILMAALGSFDHYLISLVQGLGILCLLILLSSVLRGEKTT